MIRIIPASLAFAVVTSLVTAAAFSQAQPAPAAHPGDQSRWSLDFRATMAQSSAHPIAIHMIGGWRSTITAVRAGEYDAQLQLADVHFAGDVVKGAPAASLAALQDRLSRPFWGTYRNDGALVAMHFFRDVTPSDRNLLQMIATELQLVQPDAANNTAEQNPEPSEIKTWTAQERDGAGQYSALYLEQQPGKIMKHKLKYIYTDGVAGAPADAVSVSIDQSETAFLLTPDHRVESIDGTNHMRMNLSKDKTQQLSAATEFHASHLQTSHAPELVGSLERALPSVDDSPVITQRPDASVARAQADDRLLTGYTTAAMLDSAFLKDPGIAAQPDRLTALFRSRPGAASEAAARLLSNGPKKTVTNALGAAGSPSAVVALGDLARNQALASGLRADAVLGFVQMKHPSAEAMQIPASLMNDSDPAVRSAARMISGAVARTGRSEHPADADAIDASLLALFRNAHDTGDKADLLNALGNSAGPSTIQTIEAALHDPKVSIRSAAARALRLADGSDVAQHLASVMVDDSAASVRADAIFASRFQHELPASLTDALLKAASADTATYVRSDALAVLRQNIAASPRISETLARIATSDPDAGIRRQAQGALAGGSAATPVQP